MTISAVWTVNTAYLDRPLYAIHFKMPLIVLMSNCLKGIRLVQQRKNVTHKLNEIFQNFKKTCDVTWVMNMINIYIVLCT